MHEPPQLFIVAELKNTLNNVAGVFFQVNCLRINIPKQRRAKTNMPVLFGAFLCLHISYYTMFAEFIQPKARLRVADFKKRVGMSAWEEKNVQCY